MGMYQEELKELSELFSLLVAPDLRLAWASKVIYLQEKKQWAKTTISLLQGDSWKLMSFLISWNINLFESSNGLEKISILMIVMKKFQMYCIRIIMFAPLSFVGKYPLLWEALKRNTTLGRKRKPQHTGCIKKRGFIGFSKVKTLLNLFNS